MSRERTKTPTFLLFDGKGIALRQSGTPEVLPEKGKIQLIKYRVVNGSDGIVLWQDHGKTQVPVVFLASKPGTYISRKAEKVGALLGGLLQRKTGEGIGHASPYVKAKVPVAFIGRPLAEVIM